MHDTGKTITGLLIFALVVTTPFWYPMLAGASRGQAPELAPPSHGERCVESKAFMRANHMDLLDTWRDAVVRGDDRIYVASDRQRHHMSLTDTCLSCHDKPAQFCDRCHDYSGVSTYCWDCHQRPDGN